MASPEKIVPSLPLPDTLPEDFGEWDGEGSPEDSPSYSWERELPSTTQSAYSWETPASASAEQRAESDEWALWAAANSSGKKASGQSGERKATVSSITDKPHAAESASPEPVFVEQKNFTGHESEAPAAAKQPEADEWAVWAASHSSRKKSKPFGPSADRKATLSPVAEKPHVAEPAASAPAPVKMQEQPAEVESRSARKVEASAATQEAPAPAGKTNFTVADEALYQMFSTAKFESKGERKTMSKKTVTVAAASAGSALLLLLLMIPLFHHGSKSAVKQTTLQPVMAATDVPLNADQSKPRAGEPLTQGNAAATTAATQQAANNQAASDDDTPSAPPTPSESQTQMMNDQLAAASKIPQGIKTRQVAENEPAASFGAVGADGMGGNANPSIFNSHAQTVVKAPPAKPIAISSGVAVGMLIQKTPPTYPLIAKTARVSGTVELAATISKQGTIKDLHAVSGPVMLRQAAVDAVRTWRYQPYKLNNEPTEVETTINVVFTLGG